MPALIDQPGIDSALRRAAAQRCLAELGLGAADQAALARRGFISREIRGRGTAVYKLRFRRDGRQHVRYLGTDAGGVRRVQEAVRELQAERRIELDRGRLHRDAAKLLRDGKRRLEKPLAAVGLRFHGRSIRRPRNEH
jgi:hypothetical protein